MKRLNLMMDAGQWAFFRTILESENIHFSPIGERWLSLYPGPAVGAFQREVLVADQDFDKAQELVNDFLSEPPGAA